jgi:capsid protein
MWVYSPTLDAKKELTSGSRLEILKKAAWLYNNSGLAGGAVDKIARLVGPLQPQARTMDENWNRMAEKAFNDACRNAAFGVDVSGMVNFDQAVPLLVRQMAIAGDVFWQRMTSKSGRAMFRLIPGENVGSPVGNEEEGWNDGVKVDPKTGRPIRFRVLKAPASQEYTDVSADDIAQVRRAYRIGYSRAPSWLARAANTLQDIAEYLAFEKQSAKIGASMALVITSPEAGQIGLGSSLVKGNSTSSQQPMTIDALSNGSIIPQLKPGEKVESILNNHPAGNMKEFLGTLKEEIAVGLGFSAQFLFDSTEAGGANQRWILEEAASAIDEIRDIIVQNFAAPFWRFWIWQEIQAGRLPMPNDGSDWWRMETVGPARLSVDFGRDGRLMSDLLLRGQISPQRYYALQGLDADTQDADIIRFAARRKKLVQEISKEEGVDLSVLEVFPPAPGSPVTPESIISDSGDPLKISETPTDQSTPVQNPTDVQSTALNGAQVEALVEIANSVASGKFPKHTGIAIAKASFPFVSDALIEGIFGGLDSFTPAAEEAPGDPKP